MKESFLSNNNFHIKFCYGVLYFPVCGFHLFFFFFNFSFSRNSPAPAVTAASVTNIQATEVSVPQVNSSESSGGKEMGLTGLRILTQCLVLAFILKGSFIC